jgi:hypothetical protein
MTTFFHRLAVLAVSTGLFACGGPALQNVPAPDPAIVAGLAAGVAGAATLADPDAAARNQEAKKPQKEQRPVKNNVVVPAAVFDRLDAKTPPAAAPTTQTAAPVETSGVRSPVPLKK